MESGDLVVLKLGGSLITLKDKPKTVNEERIKRIGKELASLDKKIILVHGGGSFGHHFAKLHGLSTKKIKVDRKAICETRNAMYELNSLVTKGLMNAGLFTYPFPPCTITNGKVLHPNAKVFLKSLLDSNLTPLTFGDVALEDNKAFILSGDVIIEVITRELKPKIVVFALTVDGLLDKPDGNLISLVNPSDPPKIIFNCKKDVTGGMRLKFETAIRISLLGIDVLFVNGNYEDRIVKAINGEKVKGTLFKGVKFE